MPWLLNDIDTQTTQLDAQIADTEREIELLQEYRTALISEVATEKVDVRRLHKQGAEI
jgi:type I restriction enzyme, S subunit